MKAKCLSIKKKRSKTGKDYYVARMANVGNITVWEHLTPGKAYEFNLVEKDGYKNARNIFESYTDEMQHWEKEKIKLQEENTKLINENALLKQHISLLESLIEKVSRHEE